MSSSLAAGEGALREGGGGSCLTAPAAGRGRMSTIQETQIQRSEKTSYRGQYVSHVVLNLLNETVSGSGSLSWCSEKEGKWHSSAATNFLRRLWWVDSWTEIAQDCTHQPHPVSVSSDVFTGRRFANINNIVGIVCVVRITIHRTRHTIQACGAW